MIPGAEVTFGIRPEDFYDNAGLTQGLVTERISALVSAVEPLGAETLLLIRVAGLEDEVMASVGRDVNYQVE